MSEVKSTVEYRDIPGFPGYRVGNDGSVWSCKFHKRWQQLKPSTDKTGRRMVMLRRNGRSINKRVHQLVLEAFVGPKPEGKVCRHFPDRDPSNNRLENLQWGTRQENVDDQIFHGTRAKGEARARLFRDADILDMRRRRAAGEKLKYIAKDYNTSNATICLITRGRRWKHLLPELSTS